MAAIEAHALTQQIGATVKAQEPLARHTSWRVGGPADFFVAATTVELLKRAVLTARAHALPYFMLGRGTNILIGDAGVRGLVIATECNAYRVTLTGATAVLWAEAGASLPLLANSLAKQGWAGLEWAVGVPAALGSAIVNNAGAHGSCIADVIQRATILDAAGMERALTTPEMEFAYRHSRFKGQRGREVVLTAEFLLKRDEPAAVSARLKKFNDYRRATQPSDPSAGSVFKNPPNDYAGRLIEAAGLKGTAVGGAMISPVHANFFVNTGAATANDMLALIQLAQAKVWECFGVSLELEIELVGEW
jgi:UDP-N-acetylmuramate dehydrogenase